MAVWAFKCHSIEHSEVVVVNLQHLVESMPLRIKSILKDKRGPTQYWQGVTNKVAHHSVTTAVSMYIRIYVDRITSMQKFHFFLKITLHLSL